MHGLNARTILFFSILALFVTNVFGQAGQNQDSNVTAEYDWARSTVDFSASVAAGPRRSPTTVFEAQRHLDELLVSRIANLLAAIPVDSQRTIGDEIANNPRIASAIVDIARIADRDPPRATPDLARITRQYSVPLFPTVSELFADHETTFPLAETLRWVPTREYTGIVIYAADLLPLWGTARRTRLRPALFAEIYDTDFRPVLERDMVLPEVSRLRGTLLYSDSVDPDDALPIVGEDPFYVMA